MDPKILQMVEELLQKNKYRPGNEMSSGDLFKDYQSYIDLVAKRMEEVGVDFSLQQAALKMMNPVKPKLYNPATPFLPPPIGGGFVTDSLDSPQTFISSPDPRDSMDIHKLDYQGNLVRISNSGPFTTDNVRKTRFPGNKTREQINNELNVYTEKDEQTFQNYRLVDITKLNTPGQGRGLKRQDINGVPNEVVDYEAIFDKKRFGPGFLEGERGGTFYQPKPEARIRKSIFEEANIENHDVFFNSEDFEQGYLDGREPSFNYVPFYFQDFRSPNRKLFFKAFLTRLSEQIAPEWSQETYYGRIDPVSIYKNTKRTIQVGFKVAAFSPAGFSTMWKKINLLSKMVYPTFRNGTMSKSPVIRMRIGDVVAAGEFGLPGFISSPLEISYPENTPWEISNRDLNDQIQLGQAPMIAEISFTFQVIHEENPEVDEDYNFKTQNFRNVGILDYVFEEPAASEEQPSPDVEDTTSSDSGPGSTDLAGISEGVA